MIKKSRKILEDALLTAKDKLAERGLHIKIDYSTLGESGMPPIDQTILRKIDACDIFLADITPVCNYQNTLGNGKKVLKEVPNPNVLMELGYAMSALGVGYVIVAAHQGRWVPANMPFDINHRSIYCFTTTDCDLTSRIEEVIEYIHKNGPHRHLDKPYLINLIGMKLQRYFSSKKGKEISIVSEESTIFFKRRMARSFPGCRGLVEFTRPRDINRHLSKLLEEPLSFRNCSKGTRDPIWWFRAGIALNITSFKRLGRRHFFLGWDELVIRRIVAFVDNGRYYSNYVYIEAEGQSVLD